MASYVSKHRRNKRIKACIKVLLCLILLGGAAYAVWYFRIRKDEPKVEEAPTPSEVQTAKNDSDKQIATDVTPTTEPVNVENPKDIPQNEGTDPNKSAVITGVLTRADVSGDKAIIRVNIDQYLSSGTCTLTISSGSNQLVKTANLIPSAATSTCEGFDVPSSELANFSRPLSISISLTSGDKTGIIEGQVE